MPTAMARNQELWRQCYFECYGEPSPSLIHLQEKQETNKNTVCRNTSEKSNFITLNPSICPFMTTILIISITNITIIIIIIPLFFWYDVCIGFATNIYAYIYILLQIPMCTMQYFSNVSYKDERSEMSQFQKTCFEVTAAR